MTNNSSAPTTSAFDLSIVIVNYRCWGKLADCLNSLTDAPSSLNLEVVVVDNQSGDGKLDAFAHRFPTVNFVVNAGNLGFASGCNYGASFSAAPTLLFLNPDTIASPDAIAELLAIKNQRTDINLFTCRQIDQHGNNQKAFGNLETFWTSFSIVRRILQRTNPDKYPSPRIEHTELLICECISGSAVMISRADFDQLGGWDERFWMYAEDADLCRRALEAGMKIAYEPSVTITHLHGGASRVNKDTKALTKSEVTISRHVFTSKYASSKLAAGGGHLNIFLRRSLPTLFFACLLLPLTLLGKQNTTAKKAHHLWTYYTQWISTGDVRSIRAKRDQGGIDK
jgi:GT2 family glycosyltransferase